MQEIFSSFTSIAVWAAVRFVHKMTTTSLNLNKNLMNSNNSDNKDNFYAFLPLITDPGDEARNRLFCPLAKSELKYTKTAEPQHPPMFACITRTSDKDLECHGFVCKSTEEAVSIAAQLYQALLDTIKAQGIHKKYRLSRASSISMGSVTSFDDLKLKDKKLKDKKPSKKPLKSMSNSSGSSEMRRSQKKRRKSSRKLNNNNKYLDKDSNYNSETNDSEASTEATEEAAAKSEDKYDKNGDIYTKVAMPRSRSFMKLNNNNNNLIQTQGSPNYNLQDLFKELKDQHGIASIDDLLRHVIKPEGMSFNNIEPVYRELLLKLAMSMSKDEIFIRSKTIMDEEKDNKKALLLMGGSKLLNSKNKNFLIISSDLEAKNNDSEKSSKEDKSLSKIFNKKFNIKRKNSTKKQVKVTVGGKTASGSMSKRFTNSQRKRKRLNVSNSKPTSSESADAPADLPSSQSSSLVNKNSSNGGRSITKFDIGAPLPLADGARDEVAKKWMINDIKDIKADLDDMKSGPDSGITSGGQTRPRRLPRPARLSNRLRIMRKSHRTFAANAATPVTTATSPAWA